jgi:hypothetical protein
VKEAIAEQNKSFSHIIGEGDKQKEIEEGAKQ